MAGFFSNWFYVIGHMCYAEKKGLIPIVDQCNYLTPYNEIGFYRNSMNAWDYFFDTPENNKLDEIYENKNYIVSENRYLGEICPQYAMGVEKIPDAEMIARFSPIIMKYCKPRDDIYNEIKLKVSELITEHTLGVHLRMTDMKNEPGHPIAIALDCYIKEIKEFICNNKVNRILICTDDLDALNSCIREFGNLIVYNNVKRAETAFEKEKGVHNSITEKERGIRYQRGKEVLIDAYLLANCEYLIFGASNVPFAALCLNGNRYTKYKFINNISNWKRQ